MKKIIKWILGIFIIMSFSTNTLAEEITIHLANGEWPPYSSEELKYGGLVPRIVKEAFEVVGIKVIYEYYPWKRGYQKAKVGEVDGQILRSRKPEREKYFLFSDPVMFTESVYFHLKSYSFDWKTIEDLEGVHIGGTIGYNYGIEFQNAEKAGKIIVARSPEDLQNFKKLLAKRIQIFPSNPIVGYDLLNEHFTPEEVNMITYHPKPYIKEPLYILLTKKKKRNQRLLPLFNQGLKMLKESGKIKKYQEESIRGEYKTK